MRNLVVVVVMGTLRTPKSKKSKPPSLSLPPSLKRKYKKPRPLEASYLISLGCQEMMVPSFYQSSSPIFVGSGPCGSS
jgi:hypothetical protein